MYVPPTDPRDRTAPKQPTWRNVAAAYAVLAAVPLSLWAASNPLAGAVVVTAAAGLFTVARRAAGVVHCVTHCRAFAFDLVGDVRVTVTRTDGREPGFGGESGTKPTGTSDCC